MAWCGIGGGSMVNRPSHDWSNGRRPSGWRPSSMWQSAVWPATKSQGGGQVCVQIHDKKTLVRPKNVTVQRMEAPTMGTSIPSPLTGNIHRIFRTTACSSSSQTQWLHLSFVWWLLFSFYPCPINCFILKKSALFRVGSILIIYKNRNLVSILQYKVQITFCLLEYFRISMWSVKTSMWSVSGLRKNHRFERALRHATKQNILFSSS